MPPANSAGVEILSVAVWKPAPGMEAASLATWRELTSVVTNKGYARDQLYRDPAGQYFLLRYWKSEDARRAAQEDPDMLRCWARLGNEIEIVKVYETLTGVGLNEVPT
jgi:heme-degrading monooxygenase HmoA